MNTLLKTGPHRSVRVEHDPARVVKRFDRAGAFGWLRSRRSARREFALLRALSDDGLPVPRPFELRRHGRAFEVAMEWIEGAVALDRWLDSANEPDHAERVRCDRLAASLGRLLARLQRAGLDHPDLHSGNVLVRPDGQLVAIDFHAARLRGRTGETWRRDLVLAASCLREVTTRAFRARALAAWRAELDDPTAAQRARSLATEIECAARAHRRAVVRERRARWTRVGTACRAFERDGLRGLVDRTLDDEALGRLVAAVRGAPRDPARSWLVVSGSPERVRSIVEVAARLGEHRIPAARPCAWLHAPEPAAVLTLPAGSVPADAPGAAGVRASERARIEASLADRGLAFGAEPSWWRTPHGCALGALAALTDRSSAANETRPENGA